MRLEPSPARRRTMSLTPIIDVVFLLLLFFMLASTFSRYAHVDIAVAGRVASQPSEAATSVLLSVDATGFSVNGVAVTRQGLPAALARAAGDTKARILVRPSKDAIAESIVRAIERARATGLGPVVLVR